MRRLVNLIEYMIRNNSKDENERLRLLEEIYRVPEELQDSNKPVRRRRRSGKEKIAAYVNKHKAASEVKTEESSSESGAEKKPVKRKKTMPPGFGMSLEEAQSMMNAMRAEDEELIRGNR